MCLKGSKERSKYVFHTCPKNTRNKEARHGFFNLKLIDGYLEPSLVLGRGYLSRAADDGELFAALGCVLFSDTLWDSEYSSINF